MKSSLSSLSTLSIFCALLVSQPLTLRADQVINDDLIVSPSLAVGFDARAGEVFGFNTVILKENNLRILFDDTSNSASFPKNDWVLEANDTSNGGRNFFGIRDVTLNRLSFHILAGARENALVVAANSKLGLGTASPVLALHSVEGDTPGLRLEQDGSIGYAAQTYDVAVNETGFFIRDVTAGSNLPFRIRPGAPAKSLDIKSDGKVGIGTDAPTATLHVEGTAFVSQTLEIGSSRTRKENIRDLTLPEAQEAIKGLNPVQFNYKSDAETQLGFIAEDVPALVATRDRQSVVPMDFVAVLTKVSQDHDARVGALEKSSPSRRRRSRRSRSRWRRPQGSNPA